MWPYKQREQRAHLRTMCRSLVRIIEIYLLARDEDSSLKIPLTGPLGGPRHALAATTQRQGK